MLNNYTLQWFFSIKSSAVADVSSNEVEQFLFVVWEVFFDITALHD